MKPLLSIGANDICFTLQHCRREPVSKKKAPGAVGAVRISSLVWGLTGYSCQLDPQAAECVFVQINVFPREGAPECCVHIPVGSLNKNLQEVPREAQGNHIPCL